MKKTFTIDEEIFINQFTQQVHSIEVMEVWFMSHSIADRRDIILNLLNMVIQAHPTHEEISAAVNRLNNHSSPSAIKILQKNKPYNKFGYELAALPENELINGFKILLTTLSIADNRRKHNESADNCNHWWHKDLSDNDVVQQVKQQYS